MEVLSEEGTNAEFSIQGRFDRIRCCRVTTHRGLAFGNENLAFHVSIILCIISVSLYSITVEHVQLGEVPIEDGFRVFQTRPGPSEEITHLLQDDQDWYDSTNETRLTRRGNDLTISFFELGIEVKGEVRHTRDHEYYLNVFARVPRSLASRTRGFLGNPDQDQSNDLFAKGTNTFLPPNYGDSSLYPHLLSCRCN